MVFEFFLIVYRFFASGSDNKYKEVSVKLVSAILGVLATVDLISDYVLYEESKNDYRLEQATRTAILVFALFGCLCYVGDCCLLLCSENEDVMVNRTKLKIVAILFETFPQICLVIAVKSQQNEDGFTGAQKFSFWSSYINLVGVLAYTIGQYYLSPNDKVGEKHTYRYLFLFFPVLVVVPMLLYLSFGIEYDFYGYFFLAVLFIACTACCIKIDD